MRNVPKVAKMSFICISANDVQKILSHFREYAPERLTKKIKT